MTEIEAISSGLERGEDGIWYAPEKQSVSYPSGGNESCLAVEDGSFWFHHRNECIATVVRAYPPPDGGAIFDIGGGNGFVARGLADAGFDVVLVEPGQDGARNAVRRGLKQVVCATTDSARFEESSMPAVGLFDVIEHIEDDRGFLESMKRLVKPGGCVYVTVPAYSFLWSMEDIQAGHFRRYDLSGIEKVLESAGFKIQFSSYIFRFLPLPIFLLRTLPMKLGLVSESGSNDSQARDHASENAVANRIIGALCRPEIARLARGKSMRFGGSCLLVARAT